MVQHLLCRGTSPYPLLAQTRQPPLCKCVSKPAELHGFLPVCLNFITPETIHTPAHTHMQSDAHGLALGYAVGCARSQKKTVRPASRRHVSACKPTRPPSRNAASRLSHKFMCPGTHTSQPLLSTPCLLFVVCILVLPSTLFRRCCSQDPAHGLASTSFPTVLTSTHVMVHAQHTTYNHLMQESQDAPVNVTLMRGTPLCVTP